MVSSRDALDGFGRAFPLASRVMLELLDRHPKFGNYQSCVSILPLIALNFLGEVGALPFQSLKLVNAGGGGLGRLLASFLGDHVLGRQVIGAPRRIT